MSATPQDQVKDVRPKFAIIGHDALAMLPAIGPAAFAVYAVLVRYASDKTDQCFPARATLASATGLSLRSIDHALTKLAGSGMIKVDRRFSDGRQTSNVYTVLPLASKGADSAQGGADIAPPGEQNLRGGGAESAHRTRPTELDLQELDNDQVKVTTPQPPTVQAGQPGDQVADSTVPTRGQGSATPSRAPRSGKTARSSSPEGGSEARGGRWAPVAVAIMRALGRPAPRGKLPAWLGNSVAAFGGVAGDDPDRALELVEAWSKSKALRESLERSFFRDRDLPALVGGWIATSGRTLPAAKPPATMDREGVRMARLGAPDNWRDIVYAPGGVKRSPVLALPRMGLEPYAQQGTWPAWYRAFEGVQS